MEQEEAKLNFDPAAEPDAPEPLPLPPAEVHGCALGLFAQLDLKQRLDDLGFDFALPPMPLPFGFAVDDLGLDLLVDLDFLEPLAALELGFFEPDLALLLPLPPLFLLPNLEPDLPLFAFEPEPDPFEPDAAEPVL